MGKFRKLGSFVSSPSTVLVAAVFVAAAALFLSSLSSGQDGGGGGCAANFTLRGTVLNSSFANATSINSTSWNLTTSNISVNVSIYNLSFSQFGEPQRVFINQTSTYAPNGSFDIGVGSAGPCYTLYTLQFVAYNASSWKAFEVGPSFPPLPQSALKGFLDNGTIYLQPAVTLNLTATNGTDYIAFSNLIFDDALGFPLSEDFMTTRFNATVIVPRAKNYTIMMMRPPIFTDPNPFNLALPPQTIAVNNLSNFSAAQKEIVLNFNKSLAFSQFIISGNVTVDGTNSTPINLTQIILKLGLSGIVPPNSEIQLPNSVTINETGGRGTHIANYSVVVLGSNSGIYQILEFYGVNSTATGSSSGEYYAYFSNFTVIDKMVHNLTLKKLAGNYSSISAGGGSTINASYVRINITDSNGLPLDDAHIEVKVDMVGHKTVFPTFRHMVGQLSGGTLRIPILNDSNATVHVFNRRYAPLKFKINVTNASKEPNSIIHVKLNTFKPKKFHANGSFEDFSGAQASKFKFIFMKNSAECNVFNASLSSCRLFNDDFDAARFDPLKVMVTGKVNLLMEINTTGVKIYFIGVDMLASGPPDASMSENSLRTSSNSTTYQELYKWGSVAPDIYDNVFVGMPYNNSLLNDNNIVNFTIRELYDDTGQLVWNSSTDPNVSYLPADWSDYNTSWFNVTAGGMRCDSANISNSTCHINVSTNYVWVNLPHFSDGGGGVQGDPDTTPPAAPTPANFTATPSGTVMINWTDVGGETGESYVVYRYAHNITNVTSNGLNVSNYTGSSRDNNLTNLTATTRVGEGVGFFIDNTTLNGTVFYYAVAAVDSAGNLQNATGAINLSNSYNVTVNDTIMPRSVSNITVTASDATVTIRWLNVTQDVQGSADFHNLTYHIYRSAANESNVVLNGTSNVTQANISTFVKSVPGTSANSTTVTLVRGTYHFAVTTVDDGARENTTIAFLSSGPSGNYGNVSVTPAVSSASSSPSSGGGGGGGGTPAVSEGVKVSKKWDVLPAGTATMSITKAEIGFTNIDFTTTAAASNVEITVTKLANRPTVKRDVQGNVNQYIRIDKVNLREADVSEAKIEFKVEKKWFDQNSGSIKNIVLQRYFNDLWTTLDTTYLRADETHQYFEATSPGLSLFAIVLKTAGQAKKASESETPVNISGAAAGNESGTNATAAGKKAAGGSSKVLFVLLAVLAAAAGGVFFVVKKKGGGGFSFSNPLSRFRGGGGRGGGKAGSKSSEEEEAAEIVREYEAQRSGPGPGPDRQERPPQQDQRGRPPEAFN